MSGQLAVGATFLSFLPHNVRPAGAAAATAVSGTSMNPGFLTATGVTQDPGLQAIVNRRAIDETVTPAKQGFKSKLRFALVDLTGAAKLKTPQFAGNREVEQGGLGSMAKLACMFGAYQLKFDLEEIARLKAPADEKALFAAARADWNNTQKRDDKSVTQLFASNPKIELMGKLIEIDGKQLTIPHPFSSPDLEHMFTVTKPSAGGLSVAFKGSDKILVDAPARSTSPHSSSVVDAYLRRGGESLAEARKMTFAERMFLMVDESDNAATHACIENVSFLYTHSALWQSDIYAPKRGGGLWEASTHEGAFFWELPPVPPVSAAEAKLIRQRKSKSPIDFISATPASVAALLTLMEQDRLVTADGSAAMRHLTNKRKSGLGNSSNTRSFFEDGLVGAGLSPTRIHSKLGIGTARNDCAIIARTFPDPRDVTKDVEIRYVATAFDDPGVSLLHALIVQLDKCIRENNGLLSPTTP